jgi:hypothetical protein
MLSRAAATSQALFAMIKRQAGWGIVCPEKGESHAPIPHLAQEAHDFVQLLALACFPIGLCTRGCRFVECHRLLDLAPRDYGRPAALQDGLAVPGLVADLTRLSWAHRLRGLHDRRDRVQHTYNASL